MDDLSFIIGLMQQNTDALGFIPEPTVRQRYDERYIIQTDDYGRKRGYLLHGSPAPGGVLTIAQACIEFNHRRNGFGFSVVQQLIDRADAAQVRAIKLRCADDLEANRFWKAAGFELTKQEYPHNRRQRIINTYLLDMWPTLFDHNR